MKAPATLVIAMLATACGAAPQAGHLDASEIQRAVDLRRSEIRRCLDDGYDKNPELVGQVTMDLVIAPDGSVRDAVGGGEIRDPVVVQCVETVFKKIRFPAPNHGAVAAYGLIDYEK